MIILISASSLFPPLPLFGSIGFGVWPSPLPYARRRLSFRTTLSRSPVWRYTWKVMSQDAKHQGKVGRHQTMINTALSDLLEGNWGIIASQQNYLKGRGKESSTIILWIGTYGCFLIKMFSKNTLFTTLNCTGETYTYASEERAETL